MRIVFSALLLALAATNADAVDFNCEGCSPAQMQSKALGFGRGEHRIYSFSTSTAFVFTVTCSNAQPNGAAGPISDNVTAKQSPDSSPQAAGCTNGAQLQVMTSPLSPEENTAFILARDFFKDHPKNNQGADLTYNARNTSYGSSVYQILNNYPARQNLFNDIKEDINGFKQYTAVLAAAVLAGFNIISNRVIIQVTFQDGSTVQVVYDGNLHTFDVIPSTARNNVGNPIVESNSMGYAGHYDLVGADVGEYLNYLRSLGIPIVGGGSGGIRASCVWDPAKNTLTCKIL